MTPEQRTRAIVHNAADRALSSRGYWVPLGVRAAIAETVLAALAEQGYAIAPTLDLARAIGDAVMLHAERGYPGSDDYLSRLGPFLRAALPDASSRPSVPPQSVVGVTGEDEATGGSQGVTEARTASWDADLHHRYAEAIHYVLYGPHRGDTTQRLAATAAHAVLAVRDTELETARASLARVREVHQVHSCERDGHILASTPTPCVNDGCCSCGSMRCPTLAAINSPEGTTP